MVVLPTMVEFKDVMLAVVTGGSTVAGFGLVFLAIVTTSSLAPRLFPRGFLTLALPTLVATALGGVAVASAMWWLVHNAGAAGGPSLSYAIAIWAFVGMGIALAVAAVLVVLAHWVSLSEGDK